MRGFPAKSPIRRSSTACARLFPTRPLGMLMRSEEHTSELQSPCNLVCRLLLEKKKMVFNLLATAKEFLLHIRTYMVIDARDLNLAIQQSLVQPLCHLITASPHRGAAHLRLVYH